MKQWFTFIRYERALKARNQFNEIMYLQKSFVQLVEYIEFKL